MTEIVEKARFKMALTVHDELCEPVIMYGFHMNIETEAQLAAALQTCHANLWQGVQNQNYN